MDNVKKIKTALISTFNKEGLKPVCQRLKNLGVAIYSTGGTQSYLEDQGCSVHAVEDVTSFPAILEGRVKTLHPAIFGAILNRNNHKGDQEEIKKHSIPNFDLVIVDLYPFEDTVAGDAKHGEIIEKIDIGGIALIRAAAKNYEDMVIISSGSQYPTMEKILKNKGETTEVERKDLAAQAFNVSSYYDQQIYKYLQGHSSFDLSVQGKKELRYGENPHQDGAFYGDIDQIFDQIQGKELSYNNLLDVDAAFRLMADFQDILPTFAILKHNNACGLATRETLTEAYSAALAADPVSAFGGILIANCKLDTATAKKIEDLFCEVIIAPSFDQDALKIFKKKKKRIVLILKEWTLPETNYRSILNGVLVQDSDDIIETGNNLEDKTTKKATESQKVDLLFANKIVKHTKSNTIVLAKNQQLLASGTGQTSRVDALRQAIHKAKSFDMDLEGAVMASDAFFPFPDCVEIADEAGINAVVQPGGSIKDQKSIDYCNENNITMVFTGNRHFKH